MNKLIFSILFLVFSCASINRSSREKYNQEHNIRHGVVPVETHVITKSEKPTIVQNMKQASISRGHDLYKKHCLSCHGDKGLGDGPEASKQDHPPANLQKLAREVENFKFFMSISQWDGEMPGWKDPFNESDREDLVSYIKTFR